MSKICTGCERSLPLTSFHRKGDGYQARCKDCRKVSVKEPLTYEQHGPHSFFRDLTLAKVDNRPDARQRIERHAVEMAEARDLKGTSGGGAAGLVPPGWLANQYAPIARAPRPLADAVQSFPMPPYGDDFKVPQVTTGAAVAVQAAENDPVQETDVASGTVTASVVTIAGQQDLSVQAIRRSAPGLDQVIYDSLRQAYDAKLEDQLISGAGSSGEHKGIRNVTNVITQTYTQGTPDVQTFLTNISKLVGQVASQRFVSELLVLLHPRRAAWVSQATGTASLSDMPAFNDFGFNLNFAVDPSVPTTISTTQDQVYVVHAPSLRLAEEESRVMASDVLSGGLEIRLQLFSYSLFESSRYPKAIGILDGSGLANPVGYS
jgi:hypothetical protein